MNCMSLRQWSLFVFTAAFFLLTTRVEARNAVVMGSVQEQVWVDHIQAEIDDVGECVLRHENDIYVCHVRLRGPDVLKILSPAEETVALGHGGGAKLELAGIYEHTYCLLYLTVKIPATTDAVAHGMLEELKGKLKSNPVKLMAWALITQ